MRGLHIMAWVWGVGKLQSPLCKYLTSSPTRLVFVFIAWTNCKCKYSWRKMLWDACLLNMSDEGIRLGYIKYIDVLRQQGTPLKNVDPKHVVRICSLCYFQWKCILIILNGT